jgi:hypothetical protein
VTQLIATHPLTCPLTHKSLHFTLLSLSFLSTHYCHLIPLGSPSGLLEAVGSHPITPIHSPIRPDQKSAIPLHNSATKNTKNTKKLSSFVLPFSPLSTTQITFLPSRKLFLRHPFILGTNFHHHSTIILPRSKLHSWEFVKNTRFRKLEEEEAWKWRGV